MAQSTPRPATEKIEAWLSYYKDLGIHSFYLDRSAAPVQIATKTGFQSAPEDSQPMPKSKSPVASPSKASPMSATFLAAVPNVARLPGIVNGPSLFEAADRVEGDTLELISSDLGDCKRCKLSRHRNKIVFGVGNPKAELVFVGEGPGHDEDVQGIPFVGRAGQLLTQMIVAMGLKREDVYIANVVKCRPPENRAPEKDEVASCIPFLLRQLAAIEPKVIVSLGNVATQSLLNTNKGISSFRGQWLEFRGAKLMATYHPAYLLRNPNDKPEVWGDLKKVMAVLGLKPPRRESSRA